MGLLLYYIFESAAVRSIYLTAAQIGVELTARATPFLCNDDPRSEAGKSQFLRVNAHTAPPTFYDTSVDLTLWEPNAILIYLAMKYGVNTHLYPEKPQLRAKVDQALYFSLEVQSVAQKMWISRVFQNQKPSKQLTQKLEELLNDTNEYLAPSTWLAGEHLTLADIVMAATVTDLLVGEKYNLTNFSNIWQWYNRCKQDIKAFNKNLSSAVEFDNYFRKSPKPQAVKKEVLETVKNS